MFGNILRNMEEKQLLTRKSSLNRAFNSLFEGYFAKKFAKCTCFSNKFRKIEKFAK